MGLVSWYRTRSNPQYLSESAFTGNSVWCQLACACRRQAVLKDQQCSLVCSALTSLRCCCRHGQHIPNSPFKIYVGESEIGNASKVKVSGRGLTEGMANDLNEFFVNTKDAGRCRQLTPVLFLCDRKPSRMCETDGQFILFGSLSLAVLFIASQRKSREINIEQRHVSQVTAGCPCRSRVRAKRTSSVTTTRTDRAASRTNRPSRATTSSTSSSPTSTSQVRCYVVRVRESSCFRLVCDRCEIGNSPRAVWQGSQNGISSASRAA